MQKKVKKWITVIIYVDRHSGEILNKNQVEKEYIVVRKIIDKTEFIKGIKNYRNEYTGKKTIRHECDRTGKQIEINFS